MARCMHHMKSIMPRRKLLFLSHTAISPPDSGAKVRAFNTLRELSKEFDITALCFFRAQDASSVSTNEMAAYAHAKQFALPQQFSRARSLWDHLRSVTQRRVYTRFVYESEAFRNELLHQLEYQTYDLVHLDSLDLCRYVDDLHDIPIVCTHHNVESSLLERRARSETRFWRSLYLKYQADLMRQEERRWCPHFALNVTVSESDDAILKGVVGERCTTAVVPNGVDTQFFRPQNQPRSGIVCAGATDWLPNHDALLYLSEQILPLIRKRRATGARWVGRCTNEEQEFFRDHRAIEMTGHVEDIRPHIWPAACFVVPLRIGGGTRVKILDAWAMGKAVVSTSIGCEGLTAVDGDNILIRDDPAEFAEAVVEVMEDDALRSRLEESGRATVERNYDWSTIGNLLRALYGAKMNGHLVPPEV